MFFFPTLNMSRKRKTEGSPKYLIGFYQFIISPIYVFLKVHVLKQNLDC